MSNTVEPAPARSVSATKKPWSIPRRLRQFSLRSLMVLMCGSAIGLGAIRWQEARHHDWYQTWKGLHNPHVGGFDRKMRLPELSPPPPGTDVHGWMGYQSQVSEIVGFNFAIPPSEQQMAKIARLPGVTWMHFRGNVCAEDWKGIQQFPHLQEIGLHEQVAQRDLDGLLTLKDQLTTLDLSGADVPEEVFSTLRKLPHLRHLKLGVAHISCRGLRLLSQLESLDFEGSPYDLKFDESEFWESCRQLPRLRTLTLRGSFCQDFLSLNFCDQVATLTQLEDLTLDLSQVHVGAYGAYDIPGSDSVLSLRKLRGLRTFTIRDATLTDRHLLFLENHPSVREVTLIQVNGLTDSTLDILTAMPRLKTVVLKEQDFPSVSLDRLRARVEVRQVQDEDVRHWQPWRSLSRSSKK